MTELLTRKSYTAVEHCGLQRILGVDITKKESLDLLVHELKEKLWRGSNSSQV